MLLKRNTRRTFAQKFFQIKNMTAKIEIPWERVVRERLGGSHQERRTRQTDADNWKEEIRKSVQEIMI